MHAEELPNGSVIWRPFLLRVCCRPTPQQADASGSWGLAARGLKPASALPLEASFVKPRGRERKTVFCGISEPFLGGRQWLFSAPSDRSNLGPRRRLRLRMPLTCYRRGEGKQVGACWRLVLKICCSRESPPALSEKQGQKNLRRMTAACQQRCHKNDDAYLFLYACKYIDPDYAGILPQ